LRRLFGRRKGQIKELRKFVEESIGRLTQEVKNATVFAQHGASLSQQELNIADRDILLNGRISSLLVGQLEQLDSLADCEFRVHSQWGEDGIIEWLIQQLPEIQRSFVEFGVENFAEANTRFLLENRGWKGLVLDGNEAYMNGLRSSTLYWRHDLTAVPAFVTAENINDLITDAGFAGELGILSVDIDGVDYWVLKAIECVNPSIIIAEINGVFGDLKPFTVPYRPDFDRFGAHYSGQFFGMSVAAAIKLCGERGYTYVGSNSNGVNAFFVRNDLARSVTGKINHVKTWAQRHRDSRNIAKELDFRRGLEKYELIKDLPVVNLETDELCPVSDLGPLYSDAFLEDFK